MRVMQYIFYRLYLIQRKGPNSDIASFVATLLLALLTGLNLITLFTVSYVFWGNVVPLPNFSKTSFLLLIGGYVSTFYFFFARKGKLEKIKDLYKNESEMEKLRGKRIAILYWVFSFVFCFIGVYLMLLKNQKIL